ncbi:MAG: DASH family cryptochrome, partial [Cytophagales bacterium]
RYKEDLPFPVSHLPEPFTKFRKWIESDWCVRNLVKKPTVVPSLPENFKSESIPTISELSRQKPKTNSDITIHLKGGENNAWNRLNHYFWKSNKLSVYKETRNGMLGLDYSSKLSPWLAFGCVSPRQVYHEIVRFEHERQKNDSTYWLIFELLWRDYFKWLSLKYGHKMFVPSGSHGRVLVNTKLNEKLFRKWVSGETGVAFVDANMIELKNSGFMSNRGRQNVASFWVNDLKQPWLAGAAYFEKMLIDYDPASNYGNWAYMAGVGVDPRPDRYFNIDKQASVYDPDGEYVKKWLGEFQQSKEHSK